MLHERLAELLKNTNMTQKELAEKAGVTEASMSHYLKGDRCPRASVLAKLAEALNTTADYLLREENKIDGNGLQSAIRLVMRDGDQLSDDQKMEIIQALFKKR